MKKKVLFLLLLLVGVFTLVGCGENKSKEKNGDVDNKSAIAFKNDYEEINEQTNKNGKVHRRVEISEKNKFVEVSAEEIVKTIENEETFYVYFGSRLCPWCRSTIEMADKISRDNDIEKVYYVDIWDDEGNEILRDKYTLNDNNEPVVSYEGTDAYKKLVSYFSEFLEDYTLTDNNGNNVSVGEKRIYAPNYVYVEKGKPERLTTGTSDKQKDSREELTEEILNDEEKMFNDFFANTCTDKC